MGTRGQDLEGIGAVYATFSIHQTDGQDDLKDEDLGKAVTLTGDYEIALTTMQSVLLGKLVDLNLTDADVDQRVATVQVGGVMSLPTPVGDPAPHVNNRVIGTTGGKVVQAPSSIINPLPGGDIARGIVIAADREAGQCVLIL